MVGKEIQAEFHYYLEVYLPEIYQPKGNLIAIALNETLGLQDYKGILQEGSIPEYKETISFIDSILLQLNNTYLIESSANLQISDELILLLYNKTVSGPVNHTVSLAEDLLLQDTILPKPTIDSVTFSDGIQFSDYMILKLNNMTFLILEENLGLSEQYLVLLNNETVNQFEITNSSSSLTHSEIEIGKPVLWTQTVMLNETDALQNILLELPADAQNITISKTENGNSTEITEEFTDIIEPELEPVENEYDIPYYIEMSLDEIAEKHNARHVVPLDYAELKELKEVKQKDKPTKALLINKTISDTNATEHIIPQNNTQTEYTVKFQTSAPYTIENDYSTTTKFQRNVTVAHNSTLHYTDVKSYTDIPEYLVQHNTDFKLHWMINDTKVDVTNDPQFQVTFADTNENGIIDRMEWFVPQLSEQGFEIEADIVIINVQSYPTVGGNWTVYFNTTGTADLIITAINGTTFGNAFPDDLEFLELNNGSYTLSPNVNLTENTVTYSNYTSNMTGFESSEVLTEGKHHLMFKFGNDVAFANNLATVIAVNATTQTTIAAGNCCSQRSEE